METTHRRQPLIAIVVPCYNEREVLPISNEKLMQVLADMIATGKVDNRSRIVYVDDGSRDDTWVLISRYSSESDLINGVKLAGNRGHQNALMAGFDTARDVLNADAIISIDADLQDSPDAISEMVDHYVDGSDIVMGVRKRRDTDTWFKRATAQGFYKAMRRMGADVTYNHADYRLMSRRAAEALRGFDERNLFLRGVVKSMGFKQSCVYYDRTERLAGESKYPLGKMINFAVDGITSFSVKPVRMVFSLGMTFLFIALLIFIYVLYSYFVGEAVSGWASLMISIWFIGGCILIGMGVVGEYIGKIYIEVKHRPRYIIAETAGIDN